MAEIDKLIAGYRLYRATRFEQHRQIFSHRQNLREAPHTLVITGCSMPFPVEELLGASVGELFVLRNLGGVAPPYGEDGAGGGTVAAIDYAVSVLKVTNVLILAHSGSDGLKLLMQHEEEQAPSLTARTESDAPSPMTRWLQAVAPARAAAMSAAAKAKKRGEGEMAAVRTSAAHLKDYPCVQLRADSPARVNIIGWYLDIPEGLIYALDDASGKFAPAA